MERIIECVPNFSEGRNLDLIQAIVHAIEEGSGRIGETNGVRILGVEPGEAANRTVVTFAGSPEAVVEAAFAGVRKAAELIDMRKHQGTHPRTGATDVLPLIPVSGISLEECAVLARDLAERIWKELGIACNCYEAAAFKPERKFLEKCREGEYEGLAARLSDPDTRPDFGPDHMTEQVAGAGATNVGARDFLIAVNFNLNTKSTAIAKAIAGEVRESGRLVVAKDGRRIKRSGTLKGVKAIGWYIEEYGRAQVSMNITDMKATPLHEAFEEVSRKALEHGVQVTGTEIIGLVPEQALLDAGRHFLAETASGAGKEASGAVSEDLLIQTAIERMGLDELKPFKPEEKIIRYMLEKSADTRNFF